MKTLILFLITAALLAAPAVVLRRKQLTLRKTLLYGILSVGIIHFLVFLYWRIPWTIEGGVSDELMRFLPMETSGLLISYGAYLAVFLLLGFPSIFFVSFESMTTGEGFFYLVFLFNSFIWAGLVMGTWGLCIKHFDRMEKLRIQESNERVEKARESLSRSKRSVKIPIHKKSL